MKEALSGKASASVRLDAAVSVNVPPGIRTIYRCTTTLSSALFVKICHVSAIMLGRLELGVVNT